MNLDRALISAAIRQRYFATFASFVVQEIFVGFVCADRPSWLIKGERQSMRPRSTYFFSDSSARFQPGPINS